MDVNCSFQSKAKEPGQLIILADATQKHILNDLLLQGVDIMLCLKTE